MASDVDTLVIRAPGRVNLIGGHVDFHDGAVVTAAVDRYVELRFTTVSGSQVVLTSDGFPGDVILPADGSAEPSTVEPPWGRLAAGVLRTLAQRGRPAAGFGATIASTIPPGGGLSSSAAFELAIAIGACRAAGWDLPPVELALAAQEAEALATGVPCGIQDQMASLLGGVVLLDCRDLQSEALALPEGVSILVADSRVLRTLETSPWLERRTASFDQARAIGVEKLRDATLDQVMELPQARHVVEEIARVWEFADALRAGDARRAGELMVESHRSSRDLWKSSRPELDVLVRELVEAGAYGARLTGGGFGGCVAALVPTARAGRIGDDVLDAFDDRFGRHAVIHRVVPVGGATSS